LMLLIALIKLIKQYGEILHILWGFIS